MTRSRKQHLASAAVLLATAATLRASFQAPTPTLTAAQGFFAAGDPLPGATSVTAGVRSFYLVLTGSNFTGVGAFPGSSVQWIPSINGGQCPGQTCELGGTTVTNNGTTLGVTIPFDLLATVDAGARVTVTNFGGSPSNAIPFPVVQQPQGPQGNQGLQTLPTGTVGAAYSTAMVTGGVPPYNLSLESGRYPAGLSATTSGALAGTPTTAGTSSFLLLFNDAWRVSVPGGGLDYQVTIGAAGTLAFSPANLPFGEVGALFVQTLTGSGGAAPYAFAVTTGSLPAGLNLSSSGTISGVPLQAGASVAGITVTDARQGTGTGSLVFQILPTVQIATATLPLAVPPSSYAAQLVAFGGQLPYTWSVASGSLPSGLVLNAATGLISGTPDSSTPATFTVQVRDTLGGTAQRSFTISVVIANPVIQTSDPLPAGTVGLNYGQILSASGGSGGYQWSLDSGSLPPGLTLSAAGAVAGVPTAAGSYAFTVRVTDSGQRFGIRTLNLVINPPPVSITTSSLPETAGGAVSITFAAAGGVPPYTWSVVSGALPLGLTLSPAGVLSGTTDAVGTFNFRLQVVDSKGAATAKDFSLRLTPAALAITTTSPLPGGRVGVSYSAALAAIGGLKPYRWSATGLPAGLALDGASGAISGTPTADGTSTVAAQVADSAGNTASVTLTLDIVPPPLAITTGAGLPDATAGLPYSATLSATGGTRPYNWQVTSGSLPPGLLLASTGVVGGTTQASGTVSFTVLVSDARGSSARQEFTLVVQLRPLTVLTSSLPAGTAGRPYSQPASAAGGTPPYTWSASLPAGLSIDPATGVVSGTPATSGRLNFNITVTDSAGATATSSFLVDFALPPLPAVGIGGLPDASDAGKQVQLQVTLATPFPVRLNGTATLTFRADAGGDDPAVQFASGGRTASFTFAPNATVSDPPAIPLQTGTVAGLITVTLRLVAADGTDVTPSPAPSRQMRVNAGPPVISAVTATRNAGGLQVQVSGYSPTRAVTQAVFHFTAAAGGSVQPGDVTVPVDAIFAAWYQSAASAPFGSQFLFTQPFTLQGSAANVGSVTVTLANQQGNSQAVPATVQ